MTISAASIDFASVQCNGTQTLWALSDLINNAGIGPWASINKSQATSSAIYPYLRNFIGVILITSASLVSRMLVTNLHSFGIPWRGLRSFRLGHSSSSTVAVVLRVSWDGMMSVTCN